MLILLAFIITGYRVVDFYHFSIEENTLDIWKLLSTTGMVFISYGGITKISSIAEEVKDPKKTLSRGTLLAFFVIQIFYLLVIFILIGLLSKNEFINSLLLSSRVE